MRTISVVRGGSSFSTALRVRRSSTGFRFSRSSVEILVAQHLALLIHHAMAVEEAEAGPSRRSSMNCDHGIEVVEPVLQRRAGEHEREARAQALERLAGLRFPVLDPLSFIENDQIPVGASRWP